MTASSVLILADPEDPHALVVAHRLRSAHDLHVRIADFPTLAGEQGRTTILRDGALGDWPGPPAEELLSVWWRRPMLDRFPEDTTEDDHFRHREWAAYLYGWLLSAHAHIVNDPSHERNAGYKATQLVASAARGLRIPSTLMSNDPAAIIGFWDEHGKDCIYKPFRQHPNRFLDTRALTSADFVDWSSMVEAPIIIQERISKRRDVRVNVFGSEVFAAHVDATAEDEPLDWRTLSGRQWQTHELPTDVSDQVRAIVKDLGLQYGCLDLIQEVSGDYVFIEINPSGQFLFVEIDTGQPLTASLAAVLAGA